MTRTAARGQQQLDSEQRKNERLRAGITPELQLERNRRALEDYLANRRRRGIPADGLRRRNLEPHHYPTRRTA